MTDLKTKLLNLYRLAQAGGTEGEAVNAERVLNKLLAKHTISLNSLMDTDTETRMVEFLYKGEHEKALLFAVIFKVASDEKGSIWHGRAAKNVSIRHSFRLTRAQEAEARLMYDLYLRAFREEMRLLTRAFIHRNEIYGNGAGRKWEELTPDEQAEYQRIWKMANGMDRVEIYKQLEG